MDIAFSQLVSSTRVSIRAKKLSSRRKKLTLTNLRYLSTMIKYKNLHSVDETGRDQNFYSFPIYSRMLKRKTRKTTRIQTQLFWVYHTCEDDDKWTLKLLAFSLSLLCTPHKRNEHFANILQNQLSCSNKRMQPSRTGESRKCKQPPSVTDATCTYLKYKVHMML